MLTPFVIQAAILAAISTLRLWLGWVQHLRIASTGITRDFEEPVTRLTWRPEH